MHQFKDAYSNIWKRLYKEYRLYTYINIYLCILQARMFQDTDNLNILINTQELKVSVFLNI